MHKSSSTDRCARLLKIIADPDRLLLIRALGERPQSVSDLAALLDNEIGNVSHHLKVLRKQGFVSARRRGRQVIYSLAESYFGTSKRSRRRLELGCCRLDLPE